MFEAIQKPPPHPWRNFMVHSLIACLIVPIAGLGDYRITAFMGIVIGICATGLMRDRAAIFVVVPAFLLFALAAKDPIMSWDASWSDVTHWQYFKNTMFGPHCGATECLYTFFTALLVGGVAYSMGAYLVLRWNIISK